MKEKRLHDDIANTKVPSPLIVLGIWRSGTTHLHNLLSKDDRFAFPNTYQALNPNTFLTTETRNAAALQSFMAPTRPMDNVKQGAAEPQEDEFALLPSGLSFVNAFAFPRTGDQYHRFMTLRDATDEEIRHWKSTLMWFLRKLTYKYHLPLVLKSPGHTGRIKLLLELFPEAKFVHIHRNPYSVHRSTIHTTEKVLPFWFFQKTQWQRDKLVDDYAELYDAFFEQRDLIPDGNFCEVAYDDVEANPIDALRNIYEELSLPEFAHAEASFREYVNSIADYRRNELPKLSDECRERLSTRLDRCFSEWGYAK